MTTCTPAFRGVSTLLAGLLMPACQSRPDEAAPQAAKLMNQAPAAARSAPTLQELKNATYQGVEEAGAPFALANGKWEGKPYEPGGASAPSVTFARDFRLTGDLDGDGAEEAVVLLAAGTGGTGEMSYVAVVGRPGGNVTNVATAPIGDRVQVRNARIAERRDATAVRGRSAGPALHEARQDARGHDVRPSHGPLNGPRHFPFPVRTFKNRGRSR